MPDNHTLGAWVDADNALTRAISAIERTDDPAVAFWRDLLLRDLRALRDDVAGRIETLAFDEREVA